MTMSRQVLTILRAVGFVAVIILCVIAQSQFLVERSENGYLWLAAAGVIAFLIVTPALKPNAHENQSLGMATGTARIVSIILLVVGGLFVLNSARQFHEQLLVDIFLHDSSWISYLFGLVVMLIGGLVLTGVGRLPRLDVTVTLLVIVLAAAVFLRVYRVDIYPFGVWFDEGVYGLNARHVLADPSFRPFYLENLTYPHLVLYSLSLEAFGLSNIVGLRVVSALLASLGVFLAYLVGRELRDAWFGLLLATLLAVMRWSINFSRIGMTGAELSTFILLTFYFAIRLARYGRLRDGLWFGIASALGFYFYRPYLVQLLAGALYLLLAYPFLRRPWKHTLALGVTALVAALVVLIPLGLFALDRGEEYFGRVNQVSIYNEDLPDDVTVNQAILESTVKHLEMFHLHGDNNGRHNLPGEPMLDPVTGSLMVIGLFVALRERRREHLVFLVSLILSLTGGIFSVSFEAPQSLRAIGAIIGVIYFSALGLEGLARTAIVVLQELFAFVRQQQAALARGLAIVGAFVAVIVLSAWNLNTYFYRQRVNREVWSGFFTDATLTARFYTSYDENTQFFVSPLIGASAPVVFLAEKEVARATSFYLPDVLPLRIPASSHAVVMFVPSEQHYLDYMHRFYPNARYTPVRPVDYGVDTSPDDSLFTVIELMPEDIGAIQGLRDGTGVLFIPLYEPYTFTFEEGTTLEIDGSAVENGEALQFARGNHQVTISPADARINWQYSALTEPEPIPNYFFFHDPVTPNGVLASYYNNGDWQGDPVDEQIEPHMYVYIHLINMNRPYSVRYTGYLYAPTTGDYLFHLEARDTGTLDIDGRRILEAAPEQAGEEIIRLEQGWHPIEVRRQDLTSSTSIYLSWMPPGATERRILSRDYLCPAISLCPVPDSP